MLSFETGRPESCRCLDQTYCLFYLFRGIQREDRKGDVRTTMAGRILVTGGAGFIGHHLVKALLERGNHVVVLDDLSMGRADNVPASAELVIGDVRDPVIVARLCQSVEVVCHLAAKVSIRASIDNFYDDADVNLMGTLNLLRHCHGSPVRKFCLASSMAVYADSPDGRLVTEGHALVRCRRMVSRN